MARKKAELTVAAPVVSNPLKAIGNAVAKNVKERESVVRGFQLAVLTKQNILMIGKPGLGKSMIAREFCGAFQGNYYEILLDKQTTKDEVVGGISPEKLMQGKFERDTEGTILTAHIAFLDEVFKCNSSTLNALLGVMNERKFTERGVARSLPLQTAVAASNELPDQKELGAFDDRLGLRFEVQPIEDEDNFLSMVKGSGRVQVPTMTLDELAEMQAKVDQVADTDETDEAIVKLARSFRNEGLYVSDRKWRAARRIMQASAVLNDRDSLSLDDFDVLEDVLWSTPEQQKTVKRLIAAVTNPLGEKIVKITDSVKELHDLWANDKLDLMEAGIKIGDAVKKLQALGDPTQNEKLAKAIQYCKDTRLKVLDGSPAGKK